MSTTWRFENWIAASLDKISKGRHVLLGVQRWIFRERSPYQEVAIADVPEFGRGLFLDGLVQFTALDEFVYHEHLALPALLHHPSPRRVLIEGGGDGLALREVLRDPRVEEAVLVDIDGLVVEACRRHLPELHRGSFGDPRARIEIGDVIDYLEAAPGLFDVVLIDLLDAYEEASLSLYRRVLPLTRKALAPGAIVCQFGDFAPPYYRFLPLYTELARSFRRVEVYRAWVETFASEYAFALASDGVDFARVPAELLGERAAALEGPLRSFLPEHFPTAFLMPPFLRERLERARTGGAAPSPLEGEPAEWIVPSS